MTTTQSTELDPDTAALVHAYRRAEAEARKWADTKDAIRDMLVAALGSADVGTIDGKPAVRRTVVQSTRLDSKKLHENEPEIYIRYAVPTSTVRVTVTKP